MLASCMHILMPHPGLPALPCCLQISGSDPETQGEKRRNVAQAFRNIEWLAFGFKNIAKIDNLKGLVNLTKLQLDNNKISKIENLGHLVCAVGGLMQLTSPAWGLGLLRHEGLGLLRHEGRQWWGPSLT